MNKICCLLLLISLSVGAQEWGSEEFELYNEAIYLPGTLSYPKSDRPIPLAIFIHGSGNPDRNGNQGTLVKANYIKTVADSLNNKGIAIYRYDKRTSIPANLQKSKKFGITDLVADAQVAIDHFKDDDRFSSLHLIGHSQGSLVGMLAVSDVVSTYISLAGPGTTIDKSLVHQITKQNKDLGKATELHLKELMETDTIKEVNPFLLSIFAPSNQKYLKNWMGFDPVKEIKKLTLPVLIVNGDADSQITIDDAQLLKDALPSAQLSIIPKMNHIFKIVENFAENQKSYVDPDLPLASELVVTISDFILSHE